MSILEIEITETYNALKDGENKERAVEWLEGFLLANGIVEVEA